MTDRDWSDEHRYQRDSEYGGPSGGGYREDRWQGGESYSGRPFRGGLQGMSGGGEPYRGGDFRSERDRGFRSGERYGSGRYDEGDYGQRQYGQSEYGQHEYGPRSFGGQYGQGQYGQGQYGQGRYGQRQYGPERSGQQYGQGQYASGYGQDQIGQASAFGRGQYDYRGHEWGSGMGPFGRGSTGESWQGQQNYTGRGPKGYQRSDDRLKEQVSDRLMDDPQIDPSDVVVEIHGGEVTLTGTVNSREEKRAAEACAESVSGVREVINQLRVNRGDGGSSGAQSGRSTSGSPSQTSQGQSSRATRTSGGERTET